MFFRMSKRTGMLFDTTLQYQKESHPQIDGGQKALPSMQSDIQFSQETNIEKQETGSEEEKQPL